MCCSFAQGIHGNLDFDILHVRCPLPSSLSAVPVGWSEENPSTQTGLLFISYGENPELGWQFSSFAFDI